MIIATSFLTRDDANFVKLVFTLDNYSRLLDPLYYDVLLHSLNMALLATLACLALGLSVCVVPRPAAAEGTAPAAVPADRPFWTNSLIRIYGLKIFLSTKGYLNEPAVAGGDRHPDTHYVHPLGGDHRPGIHPAAVYGDAALLQH